MSSPSKPLTLSIILSSLLASIPAAHAATLDVDVELPTLNVAEYHRPYVAVWIEDTDNKAVANLSVWYQQRSTSEGQGTKWLPDLRQWWRKSGRNLELPVDGVSGPTRPAGIHNLSFSDQLPQLQDLPAGNYHLVVEAVREVGGRELLKIPFTWPSTEAQRASTQGHTELGAIQLAIRP